MRERTAVGRCVVGLLVAGLLLAACRTAAPPGGGVAPPRGTGAGRTARAPDGLKIAYEVHGAGTTALVFVHCWACDRSLWRRQLEAFAKDYRVVALDLGGHGASGRRRTTWSIPTLAGDVQAVIEVLRLERVILVGHSMGGPVALEAARRLGRRVAGVVCVNTLHNVEMELPSEQAEETARRLEADFAGVMSELVRSTFPRQADPAVVSWVTARALAADPRVAVALLRSFHRLDLRQALAAVKVPVRSLNAAPEGPQGTVTSVDVNRRYADFDAILLEGVGHFPMLERPLEFDARLREVLASILRR